MRLWQHRPTGRVWADVSGCLGVDLLLVEQVTKGVGVRGLWDAGSVIYQQLVHLRREGPKVLLVAIQTTHRSSDPAVQSSVDQSFADSVMWSFAALDDIAGEAELPGLFIDLTDWSLRDAEGSGLVGALKNRGGAFSVDIARSVLDPVKSKARPLFSCVEAKLTFTDPALPAATRHALGRSLADPACISVGLRRSFVQLPPLDGSFQPRCVYN